MRTKVKAFITVMCILLFVTAMSFIIINRGPIYAMDDDDYDDDWVPNLIGEWISPATGYGYEDVTNIDEIPGYGEGSLSDDGNIIITDQTGRIFTGTYELGYGKLTGVILPDRTVSIQFFELTETRIFFTGRMTKSGDTLQISGYFHIFDDYNGLHGDPAAEMASGYAQLIKID
ncbi:MAG: hypothetical protein GTN76_08795 [Candidatus Aenigmarchaeota archaeon]|nr:hypothetical protein [Candidatus Aenigmarchaeota archaeon]